MNSIKLCLPFWFATFLSIFCLLPTEMTDAQNVIRYQSAPSPVDNPLKGLVPYANPAADRFPHSMEFSYLGLAELVVGPEQYDFEKLEALLDDTASRGNQTVFRIMLEYPGRENLIPKFLIEKGLKVHRYKNTNTAPFPPQIVETPDYENADLRKCLTDFISELGKRYDGDPRIAYITAGLLGTWGEWHTYPKDELWASKTVQKEVLGAYAKSFQKTPVLLRYPAGKQDSEYTATDQMPFGYHDDSFAYATKISDKDQDSWFFLNRMKAAGTLSVWKQHPIGGEIRPELWGCCFDPKPCLEAGQTFADCRDATHVTWLMDTGMFEDKPTRERYQNATTEVRKMGYDFFVDSMKVTKLGNESSKISIDISLTNQGIAPFYHAGWSPKLALYDPRKKKITQEFSTDWLLTRLLPQSAGAESRHWKTDLEFESADCLLLLSVPNPMPGGKPIRFANQTQDQHLKGWLTLGLLKTMLQ